MAHYDEDFETADAGAAVTVPIRAGDLRCGDLVVMKGVHPCKVRVVGSHGLARRAFWPPGSHVVIFVGLPPPADCRVQYFQDG